MTLTPPLRDNSWALSRLSTSARTATSEHTVAAVPPGVGRRPRILRQCLEIGVADTSSLREQFLGLIDGKLRVLGATDRRQRHKNNNRENMPLHHVCPYKEFVAERPR